jgi:hypothetical protein
LAADERELVLGTSMPCSSGDEDGMDDDDEGSALKSVPSSSAAEISLLETADLVPLMDAQIEEVAGVIELPRVAVSALLRQYGWDKEGLFDQTSTRMQSIPPSA